LLKGLLGASYEDLAEDFEITSFYMGGRWRSGIGRKRGVYVFDESGAMQDDVDNLVSFDRCCNYIMKTYKTSDGTLSDAIANYLKTEVGITNEEIKSIKRIMLSKTDAKSVK